MKISIIYLTGIPGVISLLIIGAFQKESFFWLIGLLFILGVMITHSLKKEFSARSENIFSGLIILVVIAALLCMIVKCV